MTKLGRHDCLGVVFEIAESPEDWVMAQMSLLTFRNVPRLTATERGRVLRIAERALVNERPELTAVAADTIGAIGEKSESPVLDARLGSETEDDARHRIGLAIGKLEGESAQ
jgi:hypothetical protein